MGNGKVPHFYFVFMSIQQQILPLLEQKFSEEGFEDCFLIEILFNEANKKLEIFIDADKGLAFDRCQKISRYLEAYIDENQLLGEKYIIEVSSPGISRPLLFMRQYIKNIGRPLAITLNDGSKKEGKLISASDETGISITYDKKRKEGKKNIKETITESIKSEDIKKTIVKISFS